jgi:hypothetical protein
MWHRKTEAVTRRADVKTLASDIQVHLILCLSWQLYTYNHILAACCTCSLASHLNIDIQSCYVFRMLKL